MSYDTLTLSAVHDELQPLLGGRVQRVLQVDPLTIALEIYSGERQQVILSAVANMPRILITEIKARRGVETPSPFYLLLAKFVRSASLHSLHQPPYERILELGFDGPEGQVTLICELMGRWSNLVLVDGQREIMDAIKRIPPSINRFRSLLPHQRYVAPPAQAKLAPEAVTTEALYNLFAAHETEPLWRTLVEGVSGISPLLAREITFRALGDSAKVAGAARGQDEFVLPTMQALMALPETHVWEPCLALGEDGRALDFAPYRLTHIGKPEMVPGISAAIARYLADRERGDAYGPVRQHLHALLDEQRGKLESRFNALQRVLLPEDEIEALRQRANAILAMAWSLKPGQTVLNLDPEMSAGLLGYDGETPAQIQLDPALSGTANAEHLFDQYRRKQAANAQVPALISNTRAELDYLAQLSLDIDLAENRNELDALQRDLSEFSGATPRKRTANTRKKVLSLTLGHSLVLVGRSASQNEEITFKRASGDDTWLHAHGVAGAHVIIKGGRGEPEPQVLELAARYAAYYSGLRGEPRVVVDYTRRRYVSHIAGGRPGMVTYRNELTIIVPGGLEHAEVESDAL